MTKDEISKLKDWVRKNPTQADAKHIDLTTQKEFTIRHLLEQFTAEQEKGIAIVDETILRAKTEITKWIGGMKP